MEKPVANNLTAASKPVSAPLNAPPTPKAAAPKAMAAPPNNAAQPNKNAAVPKFRCQMASDPKGRKAVEAFLANETTQK